MKAQNYFIYRNLLNFALFLLTKIIQFSEKMERYPKLNCPTIKLRIKRHGGEIYVWDGNRGEYIKLTPEEWVRRHLICWLTEMMGVNPKNICQEMPIELNGTNQRADVVVIDRNMHPNLLCECKAPNETVDGTVLAQAVRYNSVLNADFLILTNGLIHKLYKVIDGKYEQITINDFKAAYSALKA